MPSVSIYPFLAVSCVALAIASPALVTAQPQRCAATASAPSPKGPLALSVMESFLYGGRVSRLADGDTFHADHGYAQHFAPVGARALPLVMWHGAGQSGKTWETTPDGREGFAQIFLRRRWPVYVVDQPRRGRAGKTDAADGSFNHNPQAGEAYLWSNFRMGEWRPPAAPTFFPNVQVPRDTTALDQFLRQQTFNTGPEPFPDAAQRAMMAETGAALLARTGPAILLTHSHSGQYGWATAMRTLSVRAIVAFEPGEYAFPADAPPADLPTPSTRLRTFMAPQIVPAADFDRLARIPILIVFGDNITSEPSEDYGRELWRLSRARATQFADALKRRGGDVTLLDLPSVGLCGNTHFPMSDLNNIAVADRVSAWLHARRLDGNRRRTPE